jgi:hypothetical protein
VQVVPDVNLRPVAWADRSTLIGKRAATTLLPGALVTDDSVTDAPVMGAGQAVVGVTVKQPQVPMESLHPRDQIRMVVSPPSGSDPGTAPVVTGMVLSTTTPDSSGSRTVDVLVAHADADALALAASSGRVTVVLVPRS